MKQKKIGITDATYKHAIALSRYLKTYRPNLEIVGISSYPPKFQRAYNRHYTRLAIGSLKEITEREAFDLLIPVGNASVEAATRLSLKNAVLPSAQSIQTALNKHQTLQLASTLNIPTPRTFAIQNIKELNHLPLVFPCVVKGVLEAGKNVVSYPRNALELHQAVQRASHDDSQNRQLPLIQEYVPGVGLGFFGFYQNSILKRFYMHQRLREFPVTGGASTAAKTIYHAKAFEYGKKILDALKWHGPAMVEFKYDPQSDRLALMEINPKFWGSTELGLVAGINFGELLLRTMEGEELTQELSPDSYNSLQFFWPFEGDLSAIIQKREWKKLLEYVRGNYQSNFKANGFMLNCIRLYQSLRSL